jgi:hypothetical protein
MAQLTTRTTSAPGATAKGSPLTNAEVDQNFNRLNKAGPQIRPSLLLDFANSESVDNRITFSRASAATYYDANGVLQTVRDNKPRIDFDPVTGECKGLLIEEQRTNLITYSSVPRDSSWGCEYGGYWDRYVALAPDGTRTASLLKSTGEPSSRFIFNISGAGTWTTSFYVKQATSARTGFWVYSGGWIVSKTLNWTSGVPAWDDATNASIQSVGNGWYRVAVTYTTPGAGSSLISPAEYGNPTSSSSTYVWGLQHEANPFASSYTPSDSTFTSRASSATYFDSTGVLRIAGTNQPRYGFGYDATSGKWVSQGLVLEAAATNLFDSSIGTLTQLASTTVTPNALTAPDGSLTAQRVTASSNYVYKYLPSVVGGGVVHTMSFFVKPVNNVVRFAVGGTAGSMSYVLDFSTSTPGITFSNGSNATNYGSSLTSVGNSGWWRFTGTFSFSGSAGYTEFQWSFSGGTNLDAYLWGMQIETGYVATSYIPTYGSTATRAADVSSSAATTRGGDNAKLAGANFSSWWNNSAHSVFAEAMTSFASNDYMIAEGANDSNQIVEMSLTFAGSASAKTQYINRLVSTANDMRSAASAYTANGFVKVAGAGSTSATLGSTSGVSNTSAGNQSSIRNANQMMIGSRQGGSLYLNGCIKKLAFFNKALSQNELNALTQ